MPKKPLSMYMLYYSERREDIQKDHPHLSMPDVAKICSDEYQKLSEKKKARYKSRCDDMRKEYDERLESFYASFPNMRPIKTEKAAKSHLHRTNMVRSAEPEKPVILLPGAPQKPGKPFDLYFQQLETTPETGTERGVMLERARQDWRDMKVKKKAKWIRKAMKEFREYEEKVVDFKAKHPEFNPPSVKSFLTQEEQKILDKYMGRPEKPPSSAYSLFSKEMLNTEFIKQFPSKERMSHISEAWKKVRLTTFVQLEKWTLKHLDICLVGCSWRTQKISLNSRRVLMVCLY
jgi:upstream-binding transcription factor